MSDVVLARKYRPRSFDQMVGQAHVVQALSNALQSGRLHHAYLFTGTRGIGKTTVSRILAKSLNCVGEDGQGGVTAHPCGVCQACTEIDADRFIDRFSRIYTPVVVGLALLVAVVPPLFLGISDGTVWSKWVYTSLCFLVISCPCAIVISVPLAYFAGIGLASKRGIL